MPTPTPSNVLSAVVPQLLAQGLMSLREMSIMPRLVNSAYSSMAGERGSTIDVPIASAITANEVTHANVAPNPTALAPTSVALPLDQWFEAGFTLSDKELLEVQGGLIPTQASSAIRALANNVDNYILNLWSKIPFAIEAAGGAGVPFDPTTYGASDARTKGMTDVANLMTALNSQLAPMQDRRVIVDPIAWGNLIQMRAFQDISWSGDMQAILNGNITRKVGFDWFMTQNLPKTYSPGAGIVGGDATAQVAANTAAGATSVTVALSSEAATFNVGDIVSFSAAGSGPYSIQAAVAQSTTTGNVVLSIWPPLRVALTATTHVLVHPQAAGISGALNTSGSYNLGLAFHRDAIAFATRPLGSTVEAGLGSMISSTVDPVSGLSLRLEVTREYKRTRFSYDILYGAAIIRPEYIVRYQY